MNGDLSTDDIIDALLARLDELAKRLDPDMATAVLRERGGPMSAATNLRHNWPRVAGSR